MFDESFINKRILIHHVSKEMYLDMLKEFLNIKEYINDLENITLWFGKDAFCIINLITVLVYLEELNYHKEVVINLIDDVTCEVLESNIKIKLGNFKQVYLNLIDRKLIETNIAFLNDGLKDYLYITSDNNFVIDYINENISKLNEEELVVNIMDMTYKYGLSDLFILSLINKIMS